MLTKSTSKISSRRQIQIKEVKDNILILPNNQFRMVIETSSINFELKSDEEQDVLIDNFQNFLNSLPNSLQILIRIREVDIDGYLERVGESKTREKEKVYRNQIDNYKEFIQKLVIGNKILARRFYIVIPYTPLEKNNDFKIIKEQMHLQRDIILRGLEKLGMKARPLNSLEILDLFYGFYNPSQTKTQGLNEEMLELMKEIYV
ncbi:MAG TPA: TraC family protein [Candidatus Sulfotelmatobacter sp.]|nr:TraC family protein [Candidatus Sulfotelmatobacter sp.]